MAPSGHNELTPMMKKKSKELFSWASHVSVQLINPLCVKLFWENENICTNLFCIAAPELIVAWEILMKF